MTNLQNHKLESQARACIESLSNTLNASLLEGRAADRALATFFKQNRKFGSRDRRLIRDAVFAVFRWWGWARQLLPESMADMDQPGITGRRREISKYNDAQLALGESQLAALLLFADSLEEGEPLPQVEAWAALCNVPFEAVKEAIGNNEPLEQRGKALSQLLPDAMPGDTQTPDLSLSELLPAWAISKIAFPVDLDEAIRWFQKRPPVWIRIQQVDPDAVAAKLAKQGVNLEFHPRIPSAAHAGVGQRNLYGLPEFSQGAFEVQDVASQCIGLVCEAQSGEAWWDACAGGGGKSLQLAAVLGPEGSLLATDIRKHKLGALRRRGRRSRLKNINCRLWNGKRPLPGDLHFDGVLVDAPCTGSGTWRRNPDARWRAAEQDVDRMAALQQRLLRNAAENVKTGGKLIYATCSMLPAENHENVEQFLADHPDFQLESFENPLTGEAVEGMLQIWPWDADCDAMFVARLRRR
ncbi:MAG: RsmB/NOP family class I SAM-dependent RNA methyltransferase [Lentisphaeria bacterium]